MAVSPSLSAAPRTRRDLRLDFFRGLALWFIFLDHMPSNTLNEYTIGHLGFSDAAEIFVFISGFAAAVAYGSILKRDATASGCPSRTKRRRNWAVSDGLMRTGYGLRALRSPGIRRLDPRGSAVSCV